MSRLKTRIRNVIRKTLSEEREALKDTLDHTDSADVVHAVHDTWSGGEAMSRWATDDDDSAPERGNLVMPIDHAAAAGHEPTTSEQETIDHATGKVTKLSDRTVSLSEAQLRSAVRNILIMSYRTQ